MNRNEEEIKIDYLISLVEKKGRLLGKIEAYETLISDCTDDINNQITNSSSWSSGYTQCLKDTLESFENILESLKIELEKNG